MYTALRGLSFALMVLIVAATARAQDVDQVFARIAEGRGAAPTFARLITDNQEAWYARWHMVENAKTSIDCTYFMLYNEIWGRAFLGLLMKKAKEGVRIRMMLDSKGALKITRSFLGKDFLQELAALPNVEVKVYNPIYKAILQVMVDVRQAVASTHDKLLIVDSDWVITGGRNIGQIYCAHRDDNPNAFRDTDVLMRGGDLPRQAKEAFDREFDRFQTHRIGGDLFGNWSSKALELDLARRVMKAHMLNMPITEAAGPVAKALPALIDEMNEYPHLTGYANYEPLRGERPYPAFLLDSQARGGKLNEIGEKLAEFMDAAREEIYMQNPYVVLTQRGREALQRAAARGVRIVLNTNSPESTDSLPTQAMFVKEWKMLLRDVPTMQIHAFRGKNKLHAKVFVIDRRITVIGSYNLDPLSDQVNSEEVAVIQSPEFALQNVLRIQHDMKESVEYKIRVQPDGSIEQIFGPSNHTPVDILKKVEQMGILSIIRPVI